MNHITVLDLLRAQLGSGGLLTGPEDLAHYGVDRSAGDWSPAPCAIARPSSAAEVCEVVKICAREGLAIVPSGGRTGLAGGAIACRGELVLSLEKMARIDAVDTLSRLVRCEAGATVQAVDTAAASHGLMYAVDFAARGSAQIGGSIATNAGGVRVIRHGLTRDGVQSVEVVLASGEWLHVGSDAIKNNTGYDLRQLFIGSEGTLGVIVAATLRLRVRSRQPRVALCAVRSDEAVMQVFARMRATPGLELDAFEFFDGACLPYVLEQRGSGGLGPFEGKAPRCVLIEVEGPCAALDQAISEAQEADEIDDALLSASSAQVQALWAWREQIGESLHRHHPHKCDVSVPIPEIPAFLAAWRALMASHSSDWVALAFGHVGDGNVHLNVLAPRGLEAEEVRTRSRALDQQVYALVEAHRGSISAEHGIGLAKREFLHHSRSATEIELMRGIKRLLDPQDLFNPGKIF
jgi:FAD/FMN-containing dehydrogenase